MIINDPKIINKLISDDDMYRLVHDIGDAKRFEYQPGFSRYIASDGNLPILKELFEKITPIARSIFNSSTLLPSYALFSHYEGKDASLYKHKDDNACTYTLDMCVYQKHPWELYIEGKPFLLHENQAAAYYGNNQEHWREDFPYPEENYVAMIFFHFVEPDHWWYTRGRSYLDVIRGRITEEQWKKNNV